MKTIKTILTIILFSVLYLLYGNYANAQTTANYYDILKQKKVISQREADSLSTIDAFNDKVKFQNKVFTVGLEFRPRMEYRDGYKQLPNDTTDAAYFGTQRSRLYITYSQPKFKFHTSIQDIRVWGQYGQTSTTGSLNVFEAYAENYFTDYFFVRFGRQKVELDNGKLFSAANWSQAAKAHDGINFIFKKEKINSELMCFFNQTSEKIFETNYSPTVTNYKLLNVHFLQAKFNNYFTLTTINAADGYESKTSPRTLYIRGTSGGRLEYEKGKIYATMCGYYQYGQLQSGQDIAAYYLQPEIQVKIKNLTARLGAEYMSGDDATKKSDFSKSFVPLYGVAWKFMGNMDYFTSFPGDFKNGGLINPYLFFIYEWNNKLSLRAVVHMFYLQNKVLDSKKNEIDPYLGFENDLSCKYKLNDFTAVDFGFSYMVATKSMETLKGGISAMTPIYSYLMLTFKPELFNHKY